MQVTEYHLYRIKFIKPAQKKLFPPELSASDLFIKALHEKPTIELRQNNVWHIGNIKTLNQTTGVFAIGRTTKTTVEKFDDETGNFLEQVDDSGPYTFVVYDRSIGLLGIAKKTKLAPDTLAISRRIKGLFQNASIIIEHDIDVRVDLIPDPENFLNKIRNAYSIKHFKAYFTGPNPIDADELFQKPLSVYAQEMNAETGSVETNGTDLNGEVIEAVTKSTASTGNKASARIQENQGEKVKRIDLKGNIIKVMAKKTDTWKNILNKLQNAYKRVRE